MVNADSPPSDAAIKSPAASSQAGAASRQRARARPALVVIDFAKRRREADQRETVAICSALNARAARGEVRGIVLYFRDDRGEDHCVFTGPFEAVAEAANAAARMAERILRMQHELT